MNGTDRFDFSRLLEHANIGVVIHDWRTEIVYANPTAMRLLRLSHEQLIGRDVYDPQWCFVDETGKPCLIDEYPVNRVKSTNEALTNEVVGVKDSSNDQVTWFLVNAYPEGEGDNGFIVVTLNDISDRKQQFSFADIVDNTQDVVIVTEAEDCAYPTGPKIVYVNAAFEALTGYSQDKVIGETPRLLQGDLTDKQATQRIRIALENAEPVTETLLNYDINGRPYWIEMNIFPLRSKSGVVTHFAAIERDVSERKFYLEQLEKRNTDLKVLKRELESIVQKRTHQLQVAKARLEEIAYYDPLTNMPNRRYFSDQYIKLSHHCQRRELGLAVGVLDIDDFKAINDKFGHDAGDIVLTKLAECLKGFFRHEDAYCRYGGEEFAFALSIDCNSVLIQVCERLLAEIRELDVDIADGQSVSVSASMGFRVGSNEQNLSLHDALVEADKALYKAKQAGKDQAVLYIDGEEQVIE